MTRQNAIIAAAVAALLAGVTAAVAQFPGNIANNTVLGNTSGAPAPARPIAITTIAPAGANPTATVGASVTNGVATTFMRSDGAPALADSGVVAGTYTKITVDAKGRATTGATAACADLSNAGPGCSATGVKQRVAIGWPVGIDPAGNIIATIDEASTVSSIVGTVTTAVGATATLSVYKAGSSTACGSGTVLHSGSFNANGTAATNQTLTLTTTALSAGDRLCLVTSDSANWIAGNGIGGVTVRLTTP